MGFKHAHGSFGTVHVSAIDSNSALCCGGHFVAVGEVSFLHPALLFLVYIWVSREV